MHIFAFEKKYVVLSFEPVHDLLYCSTSAPTLRSTVHEPHQKEGAPKQSPKVPVMELESKLRGG